MNYCDINKFCHCLILVWVMFDIAHTILKGLFYNVSVNIVYDKTNPLKWNLLIRSAALIFEIFNFIESVF